MYRVKNIMIILGVALLVFLHWAVADGYWVCPSCHQKYPESIEECPACDMKRPENQASAELFTSGEKEDNRSETIINQSMKNVEPVERWAYTAVEDVRVFTEPKEKEVADRILHEFHTYVWVMNSLSSEQGKWYQIIECEMIYYVRAEQLLLMSQEESDAFNKTVIPSKRISTDSFFPMIVPTSQPSPAPVSTVVPTSSKSSTFIVCKKCDGQGTIDCADCNRSGKCKECDGLGYLSKGGVFTEYEEVQCSRCKGSGDCQACGGIGSFQCSDCEGKGIFIASK